MKVTNRTAEEYIDSLDDDLRSDIKTLNKLVAEHMPGVDPELWEGVFWGGSQQSIIGYGNLEYTRSDKKIVEWFMVGLTQQKNYVSLYISATEGGEYIVKKYGKKLGTAKLGSSSISFKKLSDIKLDELLKLIDIAFIQLNQA